MILFLSLIHILVDGAPSVVKEGLAKDEAESLKTSVNEFGELNLKYIHKKVKNPLAKDS